MIHPTAKRQALQFRMAYCTQCVYHMIHDCPYDEKDRLQCDEWVNTTMFFMRHADAIKELLSGGIQYRF